VHRIFTAIELNDEGEAVQVSVKPWVSQAFAEVANAMSDVEATTEGTATHSMSLILPKVGIRDPISDATRRR